MAAPLAGVAASDFEHHLSSGHRLSQQSRFAEAEVCAARAIQLRPDHAMARNNLAFARLKLGDLEGAADAYQEALRLNPGLGMARRNLGPLLLRLGRRDEAMPVFHEELRTADGFRWLQERVSRALREHDIALASELQAVSAALRLGTRWHPPRRDPDLQPFPLQSPLRTVNLAKLRHDIEQFDYLQRRGILRDELTPIIAAYQRVIDRMAPEGENARRGLSDEDVADIGEVFNRILYVRPTPRVAKALSDSWDPARLESQYLDNPPGVVVLDDFFSPDALAELHAFCLESTVWTGNRYAHGRLGAFFHEGFNCPLLVQIAEELRAALPRVIGRRHTLRQMWAFKNSPDQPGDSTTHADFAAVNINIWISPEENNLDPSCGGLVVYDVDAPPHWDFPTYNGRSDVIKPFLERQNARTLTIPYKQNRAVIFNSDLFHGTQTVRFRPEYESRRMNVTFLYGVREEDHRRLAKPDPMTDPAAAWRSAAFSRRRGR